MKMTRKQRIVTFGILFAALTVLSALLPQGHRFADYYMYPSIIGFFGVYIPLSTRFVSETFDFITSIILLALPTVLYTAIVVGVLETVDKMKSKK
jgi:hypothetical protein